MIEILGQEKLVSGEELLISHSDQLSMNPAYSFFLRQMADLMDNDHCVKITSWDDNKSGILYGTIQNEVVAIFAYDKKDIDISIINILLTAVKYEHRRKGIHTILNRYFESVVIKLGASITSATVHHKNNLRLSIVQKDGYNFIYKKLYKKLG